MSEIGFKAASRIWFGFMWRSFVLTMPVMLAVEAASWALMPHLSPGEPLRRRQFEAFIEQGVLIWIPFMFVSIVLQIQALKWTLNSLKSR
jgi:hypothetical protein